MPEIWLGYGPTEVVLDIKAENLETQIESKQANLTDSEIFSKLEALDLSKKVELVLMDYTPSIQKTVSKIFETCSGKSLPKPRILVDKPNLHLMKNIFSDQSMEISEFDDSHIENTNLVFVGEMGFDGLFGFNTVSTRLLRRFGKDQMIDAYGKRKDNLPHPGEDLATAEIAKGFVDRFEISSIETVSNSTGITGISIGHPSSTMSISKSLPSVNVGETGKHKVVIMSTGKEDNDETLRKSLSSVWNCANVVKEDGMMILLAECKNGVGSDAIQQYIEGRMSLDRLNQPAKYVDGMEDLLFLTEIQKLFKIGIVSVLPHHYVKEKLGMIPFAGAKDAIEHVLTTFGGNQKITIISDGSRILLR